MLERYKSWVAAHEGLLSVVETGLSCLTWVLPDRFSESELTLEVVHTAINLLASFHDGIARQAHGSPAPGSDLVLALSALQQVQVLVELGAIRAEQQGRLASRYDAVAAMEAIKAIVSMAILYRCDGQLLLQGGHGNCTGSSRASGLGGSGSCRQVFEAFARFRSRYCQIRGPDAHKRQPGALQAFRTDKLHQPTAEKADAGGEGGQAAAQQHVGKQHKALWWDAPAEQQPVSVQSSADGTMRKLEVAFARQQATAARLIIAGEVLHILRPVIHAAALRRWGRSSWWPWVLSLACDLLSSQLTSAGVRASQQSAAAGAMHPSVKGTSLALLFSLQSIRWSQPEAEELTRRKLLMLYYLLRDPVYGRHVQPALGRWQRTVGRVPLLGSLSQKAEEILTGLQSYFTYTSAS